MTWKVEQGLSRTPPGNVISLKTFTFGKILDVSVSTANQLEVSILFEVYLQSKLKEFISAINYSNAFQPSHDDLYNLNLELVFRRFMTSSSLHNLETLHFFGLRQNPGTLGFAVRCRQRNPRTQHSGGN